VPEQEALSVAASEASYGSNVATDIGCALAIEHGVGMKRWSIISLHSSGIDSVSDELVQHLDL
jgi:hypothetical protein